MENKEAQIKVKTKPINRRYSKWGYIFALPFAVLYLIFTFVPMGNSLYYAFCYVRHYIGYAQPKLLSEEGYPWYQNFKEVFTAVSFWDAVKNTFKFSILQIIPEWILAFWLAVMMTDRRLKFKGRKILKSIFVFPKLLAGSTMGSLLTGFLLMFFGTAAFKLYMASMIDGFGFTFEDFEYLTSIDFFIIIISIFMHFGITFIYAVVGITSVPVEVFEAAEMDGANRLQTFFHVTVPCMRPVMLFITVLSVVDCLGMSDIPSIFGYSSDRTNLTLSIYIQIQGNMCLDRASVGCIVLLFLCAIISGIFYFAFFRDKDEEQLRKMRRKEKRERARAAKGEAS
ncbi:MAG: sugar ABC transporter permease [Clostridiales bacterium]|nr:sugar ABC transporter permease [Clostridiales bacterium]